MIRRNVVLMLLIAAAAAVLVAPYSLAQDERDGRDERERAERRERIEELERELRELHGRGGPERRFRHRRPGGFRPETPDEMERSIHLLERMRDVCFEAENAAMVAIGGLKDEVRRGPKDVIADLERQLKKTRTLGLRNAIRLTLKDLYKMHSDNDEMVLTHLRVMIAENDEALQKEIAEGRQRWREEHEEKKHD